MSQVKELSAQQKRFCEGYASGRPAGRAYEEAGYKSKGAISDQNASRLLSTNDKVKDYIAELQDSAKTSTIMTITERQEWLTRAITTPIGEVDATSNLCIEDTQREGHQTFKKVNPLAALSELNKMDGAYSPDKVDHTHSFFDNIPSDNGLG